MPFRVGSLRAVIFHHIALHLKEFMRNENTFMCALVNATGKLVLYLASLMALAQNAHAQEPMPEGMIGWWYMGKGLGPNGHARDPVTHAESLRKTTWEQNSRKCACTQALFRRMTANIRISCQ